MNIPKFNFLVVAEITLYLVGLFVIVRLLNKMGLLGDSPEEKEAKELLNNPITSGNTVEVPQSIVKNVAAATGKAPENISKDDVKKLMPSGTVLQKWYEQITGSIGTFDDDEEKIYQVFREMKNQIALYAFTQFFSVKEKVNLIDYLSDSLSDSELAKINSIIAKLPKV